MKDFDPTKTQMVTIKAEHVTDLGKGLYGIMLPIRKMTEQERKMISELFPNLAEQVYEILSKEALLSALTSADEALSKVDLVEKPKKKYVDRYHDSEEGM